MAGFTCLIDARKPAMTAMLKVETQMTSFSKSRSSFVSAGFMAFMSVAYHGDGEAQSPSDGFGLDFNISRGFSESASDTPHRLVCSVTVKIQQAVSATTLFKML
jgi:hypothetical protein